MAIDMSISALKTKITNAGGLQRNNRYYVKINGPSPFNVEGDVAQSTANYTAANVLFPDVSMTTQADGLAGPGLGRTLPRGIFYKEGVMITFPVFGNWKLVEGIEEWMKKLFYKNESGNGPNVWVTEFYDSAEISKYSLEVNALDLNGNVAATYTFKEVYPIEIAPLQFSSKIGRAHV